jgi:transcriptional regulator with XRE-family HTH domain
MLDNLFMQNRIKDNLAWLIQNDSRTEGIVLRTAELSGVPQATLQRIVKGVIASPRVDTVDQLARYFNVTPAELRGEAPLPGRDIASKDPLPHSPETALYEIDQIKLEKAIERLDEHIDDFCERSVRNRARLIMMAYDSIKD